MKKSFRKLKSFKLVIRNEDIASSERCERSEQSDDKIRKLGVRPTLKIKSRKTYSRSSEKKELKAAEYLL